MGIQDRDYYRENTRFNPLDGRVQACVVLIVVYVALFILQVATRDDAGVRARPGPITQALVLNADKVLQGEVWRVVTYSFVHDPFNIAPLAFNIIFLIFFGRLIEDTIGTKEFVGFYMLASILAGVGFVAIAAIGELGGVLAGPQAAVTAMLLLVALHNPRRTVLLCFIIPCPIWFVVVFNVLIDLAGYFGGKLHPAAFASHGVAAAFAFLYFRYQWRVTNWLPAWSATERRKQRKPKLQIYRDETLEDDPSPRPSVSTGSGTSKGGTTPAIAPTGIPTSSMDEQLEAKLDEVLYKVKKYGQESLSEEERSVLFRASEIYRKRRKLGGS